MGAPQSGTHPKLCSSIPIPQLGHLCPCSSTACSSSLPCFIFFSGENPSFWQSGSTWETLTPNSPHHLLDPGCPGLWISLTTGSPPKTGELLLLLQSCHGEGSTQTPHLIMCAQHQHRGLFWIFFLLKNPLRRPLKSHPAPGAVAELEACRGYPISKGGRIEKGNFPEIAVPTSCIVTGGNASSSCTPGLLPCRDPIPNHLTIPNHLPSTRRTPPSSVPGRQGQAEKGKAGRMSSRPWGSVRRAGKPRGRGAGSSPPPWQRWVEGGRGGGCTQANKDSADKANVTQSHACAKMSQQR